MYYNYFLKGKKINEKGPKKMDHAGKSVQNKLLNIYFIEKRNI